MEHDPRNRPEPVDRWPGDPPSRLDAQKKTLGATERNEAARDAYRNQVAQRVADDFVVVDECGTNINLTPIYARAQRATCDRARSTQHCQEHDVDCLHDNPGQGPSDAAGGRHRQHRR